MTSVNALAGVAALIGEPARAAMLLTLMDGRALTAGELAGAAGVAPSTASGHLARLLDAGILALARQGRHRYYRLANADIAGLLEDMLALGGGLAAPVRTGPRDQALRRARLCYDHMAGEMAVGIADAMIARGELALDHDGGMLTDAGRGRLAALGVDLSTTKPGAAFCRPCLDWSERRPHIGGLVGRALYDLFLREGWLRRSREGRALIITPPGRLMLERRFGVALS